MSEPETNQSLAREALDAALDDLLPALKFRVSYDVAGVDPGDWLPSDEAHYNRVGPFKDEANRELTWEEWSARPDADPENWVSATLSLVRQCDLGHWHIEPGASLGGIDYLGYPYCHGTDDPNPPVEGDYTYDTLPDDYLKETARDLATEFLHERNRTP